MTRHVVARVADADYKVPATFHGHSKGFTRWSAVDETSAGAVHTGFGVCALDGGGSVDRHVQSYEESFYIIEGEVVCETGEGSYLLRPGDYGVAAVGREHAWRNPGSTPVRWAEMLAPQPRSRHADDTYFVGPVGGEAPTPLDVDVRDPRTLSFGHIEPANMDPALQTQDRLAVSASMRSALLVYSGIAVKMMVDTDLGAQLATMFMVEYQPDGFAGAHDHPLEETYLILDGGTDAVFDGVEYRLEAGDIAFAGVGCVHQFSNPGERTVRWLETQAPQPPARHSYRFARDWTYLEDRL